LTFKCSFTSALSVNNCLFLLLPAAIHGGDYQRYLDDLPIQLKKRIKDMKRIFRNKIKKQLSFRLNFDISHAVSLLREHHGVEGWVGQELEQVTEMTVFLETL
jgi:hypothetical protein